MPANQQLDIDREVVRMLVLAVGVRPAARQLGLSEDTVSAWSARYGWLAHVRAKPVLPASMASVASGASKTGPEALADVMSDLSGRTKLGFARASAKVAAKLEESTPDELLTQGNEALTWAKTAALAHGWAGQGGASVTVAVALRLDMD